jgi:hypothetical protein
VLSAHNILIAAIFVTYMGGMAGLIAYACRTGCHRDREDGQDDGGDLDAGLGDLPLAARRVLTAAARAPQWPPWRANPAARSNRPTPARPATGSGATAPASR